MVTFFRQINWSSISKRSLLLIIPIILNPLGIACYYACGLGSDPYSVFIDGIHTLFGLSHGQITLVSNIIFFGLMLIWGRKYINVGTVITTFTMGYLIDLFRALIMTRVTYEGSPIWVHYAVLVVGCITFSFGAGIYIAINLGIGGFEFLSLLIVKITKQKLKYVRIAMDALFVLAGWLMGGIVGVGTVLGIIATGPALEFTLNLFKDRIDRFAGPLKKETKQEATELSA
jgi:Predicted membrane protein